MARSLWLFVLAAITAHAPEITGSIAGMVTDGNGGILANAEVVSTHTETGAARRLRTNTEGQFTLDVTYTGCKPARQSNSTPASPPSRPASIRRKTVSARSLADATRECYSLH